MSIIKTKALAVQDKPFEPRVLAIVKGESAIKAVCVKIRLLSVFMFSLCTAAPVLANVNYGEDQKELDVIYHAFKSNEIEKAWALAQQASNSWLGEPAFDYLYGIIAYRKNELHHAVFAFERVVAQQPNWLDARIQLARSYVAIKNFTAANEQVAILKSDPKLTEPRLEIVNRLENIATKALNHQAIRISQSAKLLVGYDSNVNAGTTEKTIFIPRLGAHVELFEDSLETADQFVSLAYNMSITKPIDRVSNWKVSVGSQMNQYQELSQYRHINVNLLANYDHQLDLIGHQFTADIGLQVSPLWLGGELYRVESSAILGIKSALTKNYQVSFGMTFGETNNQVNDLLDTNNIGMSLNNRLFWAGGLHSIKLAGRDETGADAAINRQIYSLNYHFQYELSEDWTLLAAAGVQHTKYDKAHPIFENVREEDLVFTQVNTRYAFSDKMAMEFAIKVQDKSSSIQLFTYERSVVSLGGHYIF